MSRTLAIASALLLAALSAAPAIAGKATTTRIEPRPFYGATVTLEEGVRVFRPLPPHRHIVINPGNKASVSLNYSESIEKTFNYGNGSSDGGNGGSNGDGGHGSSVPGTFFNGGNGAATERSPGFFGVIPKHPHHKPGKGHGGY